MLNVPAPPVNVAPLLLVNVPPAAMLSVLTAPKPTDPPLLVVSVVVVIVPVALLMLNAPLLMMSVAVKLPPKHLNSFEALMVTVAGENVPVNTCTFTFAIVTLAPDGGKAPPSQVAVAVTTLLSTVVMYPTLAKLSALVALPPPFCT